MNVILQIYLGFWGRGNYVFETAMRCNLLCETTYLESILAW